jgi:hypothetical protein
VLSERPGRTQHSIRNQRNQDSHHLNDKKSGQPSFKGIKYNQLHQPSFVSVETKS